MSRRRTPRPSWRGRIALAAGLAGLLGAPHPASAAIQTDPAQLYTTMRQAFDLGAKRGWTFSDNTYYLSTVLDAGRAYALFNPTDPQYAELANLTVDVCTQLHYDPLTNDDAAAWYVREAATYTSLHGDAAHVAEAGALLAKVGAGDDDEKTLARQAEDDAVANMASFPHDSDAAVQVVVAEVRALNLTHDVSYRSLLLAHAALPATPLVRVPDPELPQTFAIVRAALASAGDPTLAFTVADRTNARAIEYRRQHTAELQIISRSLAIPHDVRLTRTAPADEYFGRLKISPLGVRNELVRINKYLDVGWGERMTSDALNLENSLVDWQHQYPRDTTLPQHLLDCYQLLQRVASAASVAEAAKVKNLLLVEYAGSAQAQLLATS